MFIFSLIYADQNKSILFWTSVLLVLVDLMFEIFSQLVKRLDKLNEDEDNSVLIIAINSMFLSFTAFMALLIILAL